MSGTPVPEASVHENSDLLTDENDIRRTRKILAMESEPQASHVERRAQAHFWLCVLSPNAAHIEPPLLRAEDIRHDYESGDNAASVSASGATGQSEASIRKPLSPSS